MPFLSSRPNSIDHITSPSSSSAPNPYSQINRTNPSHYTMPMPNLRTKRPTNTASTSRLNTTTASRYPTVINGSRYTNTMASDPLYTKRREDQRILFEHLLMKDGHGNYKPGSVHADGNTIVFEGSNVTFHQSDVRLVEPDARSDVAVSSYVNRIGGWEKDGNNLRWVANRNLQPSRSSRPSRPSRLEGEYGLSNTNQGMSSGTAQDPTTHQYHAHPKIDRPERATSPLSEEITSTTNPTDSDYFNIASTDSKVASADPPNRLNASNLTILNQQNKQSGLMPLTSSAQSTNPAQSTTSVKATCSYNENDNEAGPVEWSAATAATATATATAAGAAAGNNKENHGREHGVDEGKAHITWGIVDAAEDDTVPEWEVVDEVDANEEWNALDILDRAVFARNAEGWLML